MTKNKTFDELVSFWHGHIFNTFILEGSREMRSALYQAMLSTIDWKKERDEEAEKAKLLVPKRKLTKKQLEDITHDT